MRRPGRHTARRRTLAPAAALAAGVALALASCGSDPFPRSNEGRPFPGVGRWEKVNVDPEASQLFGIPCRVFGDAGSDDPEARAAGDGVELYAASTADGVIVRTTSTGGSSDDGFTFAEPVAVLGPEESWEGSAVAGPTVIADGDRVVLWFDAGDGAGIGRAVSTGAGPFVREPARPVLTPAAAWERERVRSPSVARAPDGSLWMAYEGGDGDGIGIAVSGDGVDWARLDGDATTGAVDPILARGEAGEWDEGAVAAPSLRIERSAVEGLRFRLWYEGLSGADFSIGVAGSRDGIAWERSPFSPVLAEAPALSLVELPDERAPGVVSLGDQLVMFFASTGGAERGRGICQAREAGDPALETFPF